MSRRGTHPWGTGRSRSPFARQASPRRGRPLSRGGTAPWGRTPGWGSRLGQLLRFGVMILGVLCLLFGLLPTVMYRHFHLGLVTLDLAGLGFILWPLWWKRFPPGKGWQLLRWAGAAALGLFIGVQLVLSPLMLRAALGNRPPADAPPYTVVVLGCLVVGDQPSLMLHDRLTAALEHLKHHPESPVVVSGGQGPEEDYPEAVIMARWLMDRGVESGRIYQEDGSTNTRQNLEESALLIQQEGLPRGVVLVSDSFHLARGAYYAGGAGLDPVYTLAGRTPWGLLPGYWVREQLGLAQAVLLK